MGVSLIDTQPRAGRAATGSDPRLRPPAWRAQATPRLRVRLAAMVALDVVLAVFYFSWLLRPARVGFGALFALLVLAEMFNLAQASGFWWTVLAARRYVPRAWEGRPPVVDVMIPVYGESVEIVEPTVAGARRLHGAEVRVHVLDDGEDEAIRALAERLGVDYVTRPVHSGAKAGNINHALVVTSAPYVLVLDCDHVPEPHLLTATLGHLQDKRMAFVQTPQYYANAPEGGVAAAAWAQQALFFGAIARGKDGHGAMFCAGTNVVFSRAALTEVGGFPEGSLTEDFSLSIRLHERGWRSRYVPEVLAKGLGPEDMASYVSQQQRWARGCLGGIGEALRARLPLRLRLQYLLASMYFLSGWTVLLYMSFPVVRILTGAQPLAGATADQFLLHFGPYFCASLATVGIAGAGAYSWDAFTLAAASFWIHIRASLLALMRRRGRFVVTPKHGAYGPQPRAASPALGVLGVLLGVAAYGLARRHDPATLNNVSFAALHIAVLSRGVWPALAGAAVGGSIGARRAGRRLAVGRAAVAAGAAAVVVAAGVIGVVLGDGAATRPSTHSVSAMTLARDAGERFLTRYESSDGRVVRLDQGGDTVSEGQAYAMLVSLAVGDRGRFASAWNWSRRHLQRTDGLLAWRYAGGRVVGAAAAADADLDTAFALTLAGQRWGAPGYRAQARRLGRAILTHEVFPAPDGLALAAGPWATSRRIVDPSYINPTAFAVLARNDSGTASVWRMLAAGSRRVLAALTVGGALPPDWAYVGAGGRVAALSAPDGSGGQAVYSFDAARVPIRMAASCHASDRTLAAGLWPTLRRAGSPTAYRFKLDGTPLTFDASAASADGAAAAAMAAGRESEARRLLDQAGALEARTPTYYGAAWNALARIWLTTGWLSPGGSAC